MDLFHPLVVNGGEATFIIFLGRGLTLGKCFYIVLRGIDYILGYSSLRFPRNRYSTWLSSSYRSDDGCHLVELGTCTSLLGLSALLDSIRRTRVDYKYVRPTPQTFLLHAFLYPPRQGTIDQQSLTV
jgi:hypothetical protein